MRIKKSSKCGIEKNKKADFIISFVGDGGVGKTSIFRGYKEKKFPTDSIMHIGTLFHKTDITIDGRTFKILILDISNQYSFGGYWSWVIPSVKKDLKAINGLMMVYDVQNPNTLDNLVQWIDKIKLISDNLDKISFLVVGNKIDLKDNDGGTSISQFKIDKMLKTLNIKNHLFTSAKTGENIDVAFKQIVQEMIKNSNL